MPYKEQPHEHILDKYKIGKLTAVDDVMIKAPPSGFALKVGNASLNKYMLLLTLTLQHWFRMIISPELKKNPTRAIISYLIPFFIVHSIQIAKFCYFRPPL